MDDEKSNVAQGPQKFKLSGFGAALDLENVSLNTFFTIVGFLLVVLLSWVAWEHREDSKTQGVQFVGALKEVVVEQKVMTQAIRESNCLASLTIDERRRDTEFCKRVTR